MLEPTLALGISPSGIVNGFDGGLGSLCISLSCPLELAMAITRNVYVSPCFKLLTVQKRRVSCSFFPFVVLTLALIVVHDSDDLRRHDSNLYMHCMASVAVSEFIFR